MIMYQQHHYDLFILIANSEVSLSEIYEAKVHLGFLPVKRKSIGFQFFLKKFIEQNKINLIHTWDAISTLTALPNCILKNIPLVNGSIRGSAKISSFSKKFFINKINFWLSAINISNSLAGLNALAVSKSEKFVAIHNGYLPRTINRSVNDVKKELNINAENVVGMVSNFRSGKDFDTFFFVADSICRVRDDVVFVAVGAGPDFEKYQQKYRGLSSKILLLGHKEHPEEYMNCFDISVLLSYECSEHGEGISNSIMEYMALKKPVIATRSGGNPEIVSHNETGLLIEPKSTREFENSLLFLLTNPKIGIQMGETGYNMLSSNFSIEKMVSSYDNIYLRILARYK
ncbi:MAG: glycosyltransferase family 4 protein [Melioribacteraceae bacterium]|nr:glycosyltransferase family 4 protein [Melioribacteraceae bacterium]